MSKFSLTLKTEVFTFNTKVKHINVNIYVYYFEKDFDSVEQNHIDYSVL